MSKKKTMGTDFLEKIFKICGIIGGCMFLSLFIIMMVLCIFFTLALTEDEIDLFNDGNFSNGEWECSLYVKESILGSPHHINPHSTTVEEREEMLSLSIVHASLLDGHCDTWIENEYDIDWYVIDCYKESECKEYQLVMRDE